MRWRNSPLLLVFLATVVAGVGIAQDGTIRVNTRLVEINVVVRDKNGPVASLTKEDFTVFDNGKVQNIAVFSTSESRKKQRSNGGPLPPGVVSNVLDSAGEIPVGATVILFDMINSASEGQGGTAPTLNNLNAINDQHDAIKELVAYLRTVREGDRVALFILGNDLEMVQDFTGDSDILVRAASRIKALDLAGVEVSSQAQLAAILEPPPVANEDGTVTAVGTPGFANAISVGSVMVRVNTTIDAFEAIARHLSGLPGRKSLVWLSAGFPFKPVVAQRIVGRQAQAPVETPDDFSAQLKKASKALTDANVSIYPVDYQGLKGGYPEVMMRLADATGGHVTYRTNDLQGAVSTAVADGDVSYSLGFYPDAKSFDGKLHDLKVKVNRNDVEVHHRSGYYAISNPVLTEKQRQELLGDLVNSNVNSSEVGLIVAGERDAKSGTYQYKVTVNGATVELAHQGDRWVGKLGLATRLDSAKSKGTKLGSIAVNLTEEQYSLAMKRGIVFTQSVEAMPGDRLRIVVQDQTTGLAGAVWLPIRK